MNSFIQYTTLHPERFVLWLAGVITVLFTTYLTVSLSEYIDLWLVIPSYLLGVASLYYYSYLYKQHRNKTNQIA